MFGEERDGEAGGGGAAGSVLFAWKELVEGEGEAEGEGVFEGIDGGGEI